MDWLGMGTGDGTNEDTDCKDKNETHPSRNTEKGNHLFMLQTIKSS